MPGESYDSLPLADKLRCDEICRRFELQLLAGERTDSQELLSGVEERLRPALFYELLHLEIDVCGETCSPALCQQYTERFPQFAHLVAQISAEQRLRPSHSEAEHPMQDLDGTPVHMLVGKYKIEQRLGRGAMGEVYLAEDQRLRRRVALKLVLTAQHASDEEIARFQVEAKAAARLQHPGIVQIYEVGAHHDRPFLAMEFVPGLSLAQHIAGQPQPPREAAEIVERLARAMAYAHAQGVVHRDLKPANILLADASTNRDATSSLSRLRFDPKITDFGLAKQVDSSWDLTRTGHVLGTPAYMAPEQARGYAHLAGSTADIYSLGAILYEMLTGQPPFRAATVVETLRQVQQEAPTPPRRLQRHLPRDLETICLKCLEKDPAHRYADAEQLADDLSRFLRSEPVRVRPVGPLGRSWRWARRKPLLATLVALVAAVVLIGGPLVTGLYFKADAESTRAQQQTQLAIKNLVQSRSASSIHAMQDGDYDAALTTLESAIDERKKLPDDVAGVLSPDHLQQRYDAVKYRRPRRVRTLSVPREFDRGHTFAPTFVDDDSTLQFVDLLGQELWQASLDSDQPSTFGAVETPAGETIVYDSTAQWQLVTSGAPPWQLRKTDGSVPPVSLEDPGGEFSRPTGVLHVLPEEQLVVSRYAVSCYCWDLRTGEFLQVLETPHEWDCRRHHLLSFVRPGNFSLVRLSDFEMLLENIPFAGAFLSNRQCSGIAIDPSGELLVAAKFGGNVQIFDLRQDPPAEVPSLLVQTAQVTAMRFNPSGRWLALGDGNGTMYLYDVLGRRVLPLDWQHRGAVRALRFSLDGLWLASGGDDGVVRIFNSTSGRVTPSKLVHSAAVLHTVFSSRGDQIAVLTEDKSLHLWNLRDSSPDRVLMHSSPVTSVAFDADGQRLASGDQLGVVQIWDVPTGACADRIESRRGVASLQFHGDLLGVTGATVPYRRGFSLRDLGENKWLMNDIGTGLGNGVGTQIVRIGPGGRWLAIAFADRLNLVDLNSGQTAAQFLTGHPHFFILHMAFSPDGRYLAFSPGKCGEPTPKIVVVDVADGRELYRLGTPDRVEVHRLQFTPDSRRLVLTGHFGVRVWNVDDGSQCDVGAGLQQARLVYSVLSNDGRLLATINRSHRLQIWDTEDWTPRGREIPLDGAVVFAGFDPSGQTIATATARGVARLWDWRTAEPLTPALLHGAPINDAALSPNGRCLAVAGSDRAARIWQLSLESTATDASPRVASPPRDWRPGWHLRQANEAHRLNYPAGEIFHLEHLLQLRPDDQQSALRLAAVCLQTGQWQQTVAILTPLLRGEAASDELFLTRARAQLQLDRTDLALKDLDQAAAFDAELPELPLWRAAVYARQGDFTAATSLCRTAADWTFDRWLSSPSSLPQHVQKQSLAAKEHRWLPLRTFVDERLAEADGAAKRAWLQIRAITHLSSGELESAQQDWQTIVQQWQDDPLARYALALLAAKREIWEQVLEHAAKVDASDAPWQFLQATALARLQQPADAMSRINNAISQGATNAATHALRARLHLALNDLDAAEKDAQRAIDDDESRANAWYVLAHVNARRRQWDVAADAFAVFERSSAGAIEPWQDLILCCLQAGRIDQAREAAERQLRFVDKIDHWAHHELVNTVVSTIAVCPPGADLEFTPLIVEHLELMASQRGVYSAALALVLCRRGQFERAAEVMKARGEQAELDLREQTVAAMIEDGLGRKNQSHQKAQTIRTRLDEAASLPWQRRAEIEILLNQFAPQPTPSSGR